MARETLKEFKIRFDKMRDEGGKDFRLTYDYIYNIYFSNIYNYRHLITKYQNKSGITIPEICISFGISRNTFSACRYYFNELDELVKHKQDIMKMANEMHLQDGIALSPSNPKLIEMEARLYNDEWKDKTASVDLNMPKTLKVNISDYSMNEEDLEEYEPKKLKTEE